jgi:hypothetical protein
MNNNLLSNKEAEIHLPNTMRIDFIGHISAILLNNKSIKYNVVVRNFIFWIK